MGSSRSSQHHSSTKTDQGAPDFKDFMWQALSWLKNPRWIIVFSLILLFLYSCLHWGTVQHLPGVKNAVTWWHQEALPKADPNSSDGGAMGSSRSSQHHSSTKKDQGAPDFKDFMWKALSWLKSPWRIIVFSLILLFLYSWLHWDTVQHLPGVKNVVTWWHQEALPKADPNRLAVAVAHLDNDEDHNFQKLIIEDLKEFKGVQVLRLDRLISLEGSYPEEMEKSGHKQAQEYLEKTGAHVLIWGRVIKTSGQSLPKLYWTASKEIGRAKVYDRYQPTEKLSLPAIFWEDLTEILRLLITTQDAEFHPSQGRYVGNQIRPFIEKVRRLLESEKRDHWNKEARVQVEVILGNSLLILGKESGENQPLGEAVQAYREALKEFTLERFPLQWATAQNSLGNALSALGERESGTQHLEEAIQAYREALKEFIRARFPLQWAGTQNNLGIALGALGERERGTQHLEEAIQAYREALKERTRDRVPLDWAMTQNNLGNALRALGERESGTKHLEEAVQAYREALKERTRERVPLEWARTQNNLGNALRALGERESGTKRLEEAVQAYREALKERTRERVPLEWAGTQNDLGNALSALGERERGTQRLEEAVQAYREALKERTRERVPLEWAGTQNNLGNTLRALGERKSGTKCLEEAVQAHREALKESTRDRVPLDWAGTQNNLGNALSVLGERENGTQHLEEAVQAYREALKEFTRDRVPLYWTMTQNNLGNALQMLGERKNSADVLCMALDAHCLAWEVLSAETSFYASATRDRIRGDVSLLRSRFTPEEYQACVKRHADVLNQVTK
jgi:tetratricopeptide (TPR) repeat protein